MHIAKYFALAALITSGAVAAPGKSKSPAPPPKPPPPPPPPPPPTNSNSGSQSNKCGNGATGYCCYSSSDNSKGSSGGTETQCEPIGSSCAGTTICCNNGVGVQVCLGNVVLFPQGIF